MLIAEGWDTDEYMMIIEKSNPLYIDIQENSIETY